jgi:transposase
VNDAEWRADLLRHGLLRHGLLRASFIPPAPQRHLRDLTRYRIHLVASLERAGSAHQSAAGRVGGRQ